MKFRIFQDDSYIKHSEIARIVIKLSAAASAYQLSKSTDTSRNTGLAWQKEKRLFSFFFSFFLAADCNFQNQKARDRNNASTIVFTLLVEYLYCWLVFFVHTPFFFRWMNDYKCNMMFKSIFIWLGNFINSFRFDSILTAGRIYLLSCFYMHQRVVPLRPRNQPETGILLFSSWGNVIGYRNWRHASRQS